MNSFSQQQILLGVTGGIAAYKIPLLVRSLTQAGAIVRVVMTASAQRFVTPLTLQTLSGEAVYADLIDDEQHDPMLHIHLARWADRVLIAPATANIIAKLAQGAADDLLSTVCLATQAPIALAPAMNQQMWKNPATQANIKQLIERGITCFEPAIGEQACGEFGPGRMQTPEQLLEKLASHGCPETPEISLKNQHIVIGAGGTKEPIDVARYISNHSSGKMGYALAEAAVDAGASVILISSATDLPTPSGVRLIPVKTAQQMHQAVMRHVVDADIYIGAAAVADFRVKEPCAGKIKKEANEETLTLTLIKNPDIIREVAHLHKAVRPFTVGFAAEVDALKENARQKRQAKKLDMIIANQIGQDDRGFNSDDNAALVLWAQGEKNLPLQSKKQLAKQILHCVFVAINADKTRDLSNKTS